MPRFHFFRFLVMLAALLLPSLPVAASEIYPVHDGQGRLIACTAKHLDSEGKGLIIGYETAGTLYLDATIPKAGFKAGARYDITLRLPDTGFNRNVRARAMTNETLRLQLQTPGFSEDLPKSTRLVLEANTNQIVYALPALAPVFTELRACASAQPLAPSPQPAPHPTPSLSEIKMPAPQPQTQQPPPTNTSATFPAALSQVLARAGFTDIKPLSMQNTPPAQRPADYIWQVGTSVLAGVKQRDVPQELDLTHLAGLHIQGLKTKCNGTFTAKVGRSLQKGDLSLRKAQARCAPDQSQSGEAVSVALLMLLSKEEGLTVYTHEAPDTHKEDAFAARDQLARLWE